MMLVDTSPRRLGGDSGDGLRGIADDAQLAESLGFDGLIFGEIRTDPLIDATLAITATSRIEVATNVLIAFPRSPMVVAYATRNLQELSGGRFTLGIGTQVRGHIVRRFSAEWDAPVRCLREYVQALRAIWASWQTGAPLDYRGRFYQFTLMTPEFSLGPNDHPTRLNIAAMNPFNVATAAMLCDGLTLHSLMTPSYIREVIWPAVERAACSAQRSLATFEMSGGGCWVGERFGGLVDRVHISLPREQRPADMKRAERALEAIRALPSKKRRGRDEYEYEYD